MLRVEAEEEEEIYDLMLLRRMKSLLWTEFNRRRRLWIRTLVVLCGLFLLFRSRRTGLLVEQPSPNTHQHSSSSPSSSNNNPPPTDSPHKNFLHLLIPATHPELNLCKTLLSAALLNYSTPTLINWGKTYSDPNLAKGGSHLAKIPGINAYLQSLGAEHNNDLVLIVDGYDTWFQLPPAILISRYHGINDRANKRIAARLGTSSHPVLSSIKQSVVFSAQKLCWPHHADELACRAAPKSPLPDDVFGEETDLPFADDEENPYLRTRPRFMNSGLMIGPVGDLRRLFAEAMERMEEDPHDGSDQGVFSDILGVQEFWREILRRRYLSRFERVMLWLKGFLTGAGAYNALDRGKDQLLRPHPAHETLDVPTDLSDDMLLKAEFGLGLDYASELSHATVFAPRDADWLFFSSPDLPSRYWHIRSPRITSLPSDLATPPPPFAGLTFSDREERKLWTTTRTTTKKAAYEEEDENSTEEEEEQVANPTWAEIPLYTHLWTGTVPVSIHHNAWQRNMKSLREKMWNQMWWSPYAREMLRAHRLGDRVPIVVGENDAMGRKREWWSPVERKGGVRLDNGTFVDWEHVCGEWEWELFGGGVG